MDYFQKNCLSFLSSIHFVQHSSNQIFDWKQWNQIFLRQPIPSSLEQGNCPWWLESGSMAGEGRSVAQLNEFRNIDSSCVHPGTVLVDEHFFLQISRFFLKSSLYRHNNLCWLLFPFESNRCGLYRFSRRIPPFRLLLGLLVVVMDTFFFYAYESVQEILRIAKKDAIYSLEDSTWFRLKTIANKLYTHCAVSFLIPKWSLQIEFFRSCDMPMASTFSRTSNLWLVNNMSWMFSFSLSLATSIVPPDWLLDLVQPQRNFGSHPFTMGIVGAETPESVSLSFAFSDDFSGKTMLAEHRPFTFLVAQMLFAPVLKYIYTICGVYSLNSRKFYGTLRARVLPAIDRFFRDPFFYPGKIWREKRIYEGDPIFNY